MMRRCTANDASRKRRRSIEMRPRFQPPFIFSSPSRAAATAAHYVIRTLFYNRSKTGRVTFDSTVRQTLSTSYRRRGPRTIAPVYFRRRSSQMRPRFPSHSYEHCHMEFDTSTFQTLISDIRELQQPPQNEQFEPSTSTSYYDRVRYVIRLMPHQIPAGEAASAVA
jgi:hypothetical protein